MEDSGIPNLAEHVRASSIAELRQVLLDMTWTSLRVQARFLGEYGLTNFQALVMRALAVQDAPPDMAFLAEMTALPPSTMTSVVDRLERDGLAERVPHARDRRKILVSLTLKGRSLLERLDEEALRFTADLLQDVDDESMATVIGVLHQMNDRLKRFDGEAQSVVEPER